MCEQADKQDGDARCSAWSDGHHRAEYPDGKCRCGFQVLDTIEHQYADYFS